VVAKHEAGVATSQLHCALAGESRDGGAKYWSGVAAKFPRKFRLTATESLVPKLIVPLLQVIVIDGLEAEKTTLGQSAAVFTMEPVWLTCQLR
jgi:hypothetical protein